MSGESATPPVEVFDATRLFGIAKRTLKIRALALATALDASDSALLSQSSATRSSRRGRGDGVVALVSHDGQQWIVVRPGRAVGSSYLVSVASCR